MSERFWDIWWLLSHGQLLGQLKFWRYDLSPGTRTITLLVEWWHLHPLHNWRGLTPKVRRRLLFECCPQNLSLLSFHFTFNPLALGEQALLLWHRFSHRLDIQTYAKATFARMNVSADHSFPWLHSFLLDLSLMIGWRKFKKNHETLKVCLLFSLSCLSLCLWMSYRAHFLT